MPFVRPFPSFAAWEIFNPLSPPSLHSSKFRKQLAVMAYSQGFSHQHIAVSPRVRRGRDEDSTTILCSGFETFGGFKNSLVENSPFYGHEADSKIGKHLLCPAGAHQARGFWPVSALRTLMLAWDLLTEDLSDCPYLDTEGIWRSAFSLSADQRQTELWMLS